MAEFLDSNNIKVYPSGYRDAEIDLNASRTSEESTTRLLKAAIGFYSYVKEEADNSLTIVVDGYVFNVKSGITNIGNLFPNPSSGTKVYAKIVKKDIDLATTLQLMMLVNAEDESNLLDEGNPTKFKGLVFSTTNSGNDLLVLSYSSGWSVPAESKLNIKPEQIPLATASSAGLISTGVQTFAGLKTFNGSVSFNSEADCNSHLYINNSSNLKISTYPGSSSDYIIINKQGLNIKPASEVDNSHLSLDYNELNISNYNSSIYTSIKRNQIDFSSLETVREGQTTPNILGSCLRSWFDRNGTDIRNYIENITLKADPSFNSCYMQLRDGTNNVKSNVDLRTYIKYGKKVYDYGHFQTLAGRTINIYSFISYALAEGSPFHNCSALLIKAKITQVYDAIKHDLMDLGVFELSSNFITHINIPFINRVCAFYNPGFLANLNKLCHLNISNASDPDNNVYNFAVTIRDDTDHSYSDTSSDLYLEFDIIGSKE